MRRKVFSAFRTFTRHFWVFWKYVFVTVLFYFGFNGSLHTWYCRTFRSTHFRCRRLFYFHLQATNVNLIVLERFYVSKRSGFRIPDFRLLFLLRCRNFLLKLGLLNVFQTMVSLAATSFTLRQSISFVVELYIFSQNSLFLLLYSFSCDL